MQSMFIVTGVLAAVALTLVYALLRLAGSYRRIKRDVQYFQQKYRTKVGWTIGKGNYYIVSIDGGKHWFDVEKDGNGGLIVTGPTDPAFVQEREGMDELFAHVRQHGPIDLGQPNQVGILQKAGFTVQRRDM